MTAREHVVAAAEHLVAALAQTQTESYQQNREPMIPMGAVERAVASLAAYAVNPKER